MHRVWSWIELVLRQYPWALTLAAMVPCAYFDAAGVNHLVASNLFKADVDSLAQSGGGSFLGTDATSQHESNDHHMRDAHQILARDVFDSTAGCLNCEVASDGDAGVTSADGGVQVATGIPEPCTGPSKVTGAVVIDDAAWSFAFVSVNGHDPAMPFQMGQEIDGKRVSSVGWNTNIGAYIVLRAGAMRCYFAQYMPVHATTAPDAGAVAHASPDGGMSSGLLSELEHGIERNGNEFSVRRSLVNQILENPAELMRTTRIMPQMQDGHVVGVSLMGVRGDSLLGHLGLQNGDVLSRINGLEIGTPDRALEAYSRLQTADRISLSVMRNNQPVTIDFNIHQ